MKTKDLVEFVRIAASSEEICAYTLEKEIVKARFHRLGKQVCRELAKLMELPKGSYRIDSNLGGIAVSGEITLHGEFIYLQFSQSVLGPTLGFMYRYCRGNRDYGGDLRHCPNVWAPWHALLELDAVAQTIKTTCRRYRDRDPQAAPVKPEPLISP